MLVIDGLSMEDIRSEGYLRGYQNGAILQESGEHTDADAFIHAALTAEKKSRYDGSFKSLSETVRAFEVAGWDAWGTFNDGVLAGIKDSMIKSTW